MEGLAVTREGWAGGVRPVGLREWTVAGDGLDAGGWRREGPWIVTAATASIY